MDVFFIHTNSYIVDNIGLWPNSSAFANTDNTK